MDVMGSTKYLPFPSCTLSLHYVKIWILTVDYIGSFYRHEKFFLEIKIFIKKLKNWCNTVSEGSDTIIDNIINRTDDTVLDPLNIRFSK